MTAAWSLLGPTGRIQPVNDIQQLLTGPTQHVERRVNFVRGRRPSIPSEKRGRITMHQSFRHGHPLRYPNVRSRIG